jgi:hypothetical protein
VGAIPDHPVKIFVENQKEPISLTPNQISSYLNYIIQNYATAFGGFLLLIMFLSIIITVGGMKKTHRILLSRPATTESRTA